ncbi:MAG: hypothetical protein CMH54_09990, partial [Myxococcales bacterium]|nr:hypothetical protein [Myxococcales bacterium]
AGAGVERMGWTSDVRLRYRPTIHISDAFSVSMAFDAFENIEAGTGIGFYGEESEDSLVRMNGDRVSDGIRVPYLYGTWEPLSRVWIRMGRMPEHFGLGLSENDGECHDCDVQTLVDGIDLRTDLFDMGTRLAWRRPGEGFTSERGQFVAGQPYDLDQSDDISEILVELSGALYTPLETANRIRAARLSNEWLFDWAVRLRMRSAGRQSDQALDPGACVEDAEGTGPQTSFDCIAYVPRNADLWYPGIFLHLEGWPVDGHHLAFGLELQAVLGDIQQTQAFSDEGLSRDVQAFAGALRASYTTGRIRARIDAGFATGEPEGRYIGVQDGSNTVAPSTEIYNTQSEYLENATYEQFIAHPSFFVDEVLYRYLLGAATNTVYVGPTLGFDVLRGRHSLGIDLTAMGSWAMARENTPGGGGFYGVETRLGLDYRFQERLSIATKTVLFLPGDALVSAGSEAGPILLNGVDLFWDF